MKKKFYEMSQRHVSRFDSLYQYSVTCMFMRSTNNLEWFIISVSWLDSLYLYSDIYSSWYLYPGLVHDIFILARFMMSILASFIVFLSLLVHDICKSNLVHDICFLEWFMIFVSWVHVISILVWFMISLSWFSSFYLNPGLIHDIWILAWFIISLSRLDS